jgi:predicted nucleic acid-binding Zn ribbon protein
MALKNSRKCNSCGAILVGRVDKKYCSDQCRYLENNKRKQETHAIEFELNSALRKNRTILKTLCPEGKSVVRKTVLDDMGFRSDLFTSLYMTSKKQMYYLCYDFGFSPLIEKGVEKVLIVTRQSYMSSWQPWKFVKK